MPATPARCSSVVAPEAGRLSSNSINTTHHPHYDSSNNKLVISNQWEADKNNDVWGRRQETNRRFGSAAGGAGQVGRGDAPAPGGEEEGHLLEGYYRVGAGGDGANTDGGGGGGGAEWVIMSERLYAY